MNVLKRIAGRIRNKRLVAGCQNLVNRAKGRVGLILLPLMSKRVERLIQSRFSFSSTDDASFLDALIRAGLAKRACASGNPTDLAEYHRNFWKGQDAEDYHDQRKEGIWDQFQTDFPDVVRALELLVTQPTKFSTLCEIGTGSGELLAGLGGRLPSLERLIGIDLCEATIRGNQSKYHGQRFDWVAGDASKWIQQHAGKNCVFVSYRGVLEYFTQQELVSLFEFLSRECQPVIFVAVEPVAANHDLTKQNDSRTYGNEFSFSHNYPCLFRNAGFQVREVQEKEHSTYWMRAFIATIGVEDRV